MWPIPIIEGLGKFFIIYIGQSKINLGAEMEQIIGEFQHEWDRSMLPKRLLSCVKNFQI